MISLHRAVLAAPLLLAGSLAFAQATQKVVPAQSEIAFVTKQMGVPVDGKFGCAIRQTINGKRIEGPSGFATQDEAINGGLDELRKTLGWG